MKKIFLVSLSLMVFSIFYSGCSYNSYYDPGYMPQKTVVTTTEYYSSRSAWAPAYSQTQYSGQPSVQPPANACCNQPCSQPTYRSSGVDCGCQCSYGYCKRCRRSHCCPDP